MQNGEIINNTCGIFKEHMLCGEEDGSMTYFQDANPGNVYAWESGNCTRRFANIGEPDLANPSPCLIKQSLDQQAKSKALANVDATPYEFFEDLLEIRETIRFLKSPVKAIVDVAKLFSEKRRKIDTIKDSILRAKKLAALWNTYRFAVSPLVRSIQSGIELFEKYETIERPPRRSSHGFGSETTPTITTKRERVFGTTQHKFYVQGEITYSSHASILYTVSNPVNDWLFKLGLRPKDIPHVMWQIVPLSFMVDRLINISDIIRGVINLSDPRVQVLAASLRTKEVSTVKCTLTEIIRPGWTYTWDKPDWFFEEKYQYLRIPWIPTVSDTVPPFIWGGLIEDATKTLDLLSIAISLLKVPRS
jgi:hypothetical protein